MLDPDRVNGYFERDVIEVAPLAFMRGRTLNDSFVILDEAQNTSPEQMKMFLTRLGFNSRMVVTGDITQIDLPSDQRSGLIAVRDILDEVQDISFIEFGGEDVVRHKLVQRIVAAYDEHGASRAEHGPTPALDADLRVPPSCARRSRRRSRRPASPTATSRSRSSTTERIRELNREHRGKDAPTDVLAFPVDGTGPVAGPRELGDVAICPEHCTDVTEAAVHGVLHLCGHDHETDDGEMLALQAEILQRCLRPGDSRDDRRAPASSASPGAPTSASRPWSTRSSAPTSRSSRCARRRRAGRSAASPPTSRPGASWSSSTCPACSARATSLTERMQQRVERELADSDVALLVINGEEGVGPGDRFIARALLGAGAEIPVICAVNKADRLGPNEHGPGALRRRPSCRASTRSSRSAPAPARAWRRCSSGSAS